MRKPILFLALLLTIAGVQAQVKSALTLEDCLKLARQNYPLIRQRALILKSKDYSVQNAAKGYLPQIVINGQATYQSQVTEIPIHLPGVNIPQLSKDQYRIYGEVSQPLYDGGMVKQQKRAQEASAVVEEQKLETELYKLKERVNQLFFGILLLDEQLNLSELLRKDVQNGIHKTDASIVNGTAFKTNAALLSAELLKIDQRSIELKASRKAYVEMLGLFINQSLDENVSLVRPQSPVLSQTISRPELLIYDRQAESISIQAEMLRAKNLPKLNLFVQGGYGRPALNLLSNKFETYYIGGLRLNWTLTGLYTFKKEKALLDINRQSLDVQRELFLFNTNFTVKQQNAELLKLQQLLASDDEIITLRSGIKQTANAQLENGVISTNDYLREVNAEDQARENKLMHEVQLLMAQYALQTTTGE